MKKDKPKTLVLNNPNSTDLKRLSKIKKSVTALKTVSSSLSWALYYAELWLDEEQRKFNESAQAKSETL